MKKFKYAIHREGNLFVAQCLDVDISSFGETEQEALKNLEEALQLYYDDSPPST